MSLSAVTVTAMDPLYLIIYKRIIKQIGNQALRGLIDIGNNHLGGETTIEVRK